MLQVLEEKPSGLLVASLQAKDPDEGENGTIIYSLIGMSCRTDLWMPLSALQPSPLWAAGCPLPQPCHATLPPPSQPAPCPSSSLPLLAAFHLLSAGAWAERFTLHKATGELRTATVLRRTDRAEYIFTVTASDRGMVPRSTSAIIRIQVSSTPAPLVPAPFTPRSPLRGHHPATCQPSFPTFSPSTTFIPGHPLRLLSC